MKLAEALQERADLNRKIAELRGRIINNALVQEGEKPAEDPEELIGEMNSALKRLNELIAGINLRMRGQQFDAAQRVQNHFAHHAARSSFGNLLRPRLIMRTRAGLSAAMAFFFADRIDCQARDARFGIKLPGIGVA